MVDSDTVTALSMGVLESPLAFPSFLWPVLRRGACPVLGGKRAARIFTLWDVPYYRHHAEQLVSSDRHDHTQLHFAMRMPKTWRTPYGIAN